MLIKVRFRNHADLRTKEPCLEIFPIQMRWIRQLIGVEHGWLDQKKLTTHSHLILHPIEEEVAEEGQMEETSHATIVERRDTSAAIAIKHEDKVKIVKADPRIPNQ